MRWHTAPRRTRRLNLYARVSLCGLLAADYLALRELYPPPASCGGAEGLLRAWGEVNQRWAAAMRTKP